MRCISCHLSLLTEDKFVRFVCPACNKAEIIRCAACRKRSVIYVCPECGFEGP